MRPVIRHRPYLPASRNSLWIRHPRRQRLWLDCRSLTSQRLTESATATDPRTPLWLQEHLGIGPTKIVALVADGTTNPRVVHKDGSTTPVVLISDVLSADLPAGASVAFDDASGSAVTLTPAP
jgi:hypothetical protein